MATKPTGGHLDWVTDDDPAKFIAPSSAKKLQGWIANEKPPFQYFNWLFRLVDRWLKWAEAQSDENTAAIGVNTAAIGTNAAAILAEAQARAAADNSHAALDDAHGATTTPTEYRIARFDASKRLSSGAAAASGNNCIRLTDLGTHIGATSEGSVGSYHFLALNSLGAAITNQLYAGSSLQRVGISFDASGDVKSGFAGVATMLGTWQPMGSVFARAGYYPATVFKRVS